MIMIKQKRIVYHTRKHKAFLINKSSLVSTKEENEKNLVVKANRKSVISTMKVKFEPFVCAKEPHITTKVIDINSQCPTEYLLI